MGNIHIRYNIPLSGEFSLHYGDCESPIDHPKDLHHHQIGQTIVRDHPLAKKNAQWEGNRPEKFVWLVPENAADAGCLFAYSGHNLAGRSEKVNAVKRRARRSIDLGDVGDAEGPWFNGVAYLQDKEPDSVFVAQAKSKTIGILGGGMSGLMSSVSHGMVQRAMNEIHGLVAQEQFTGNYDRHCWEHDPFEMGAWCGPSAGQQELHLPAYFRTEFKAFLLGVIRVIRMRGFGARWRVRLGEPRSCC